jgi:aspartyl/asparaginyl beta-hydroxylase (cupin superfamily)
MMQPTIIIFLLLLVSIVVLVLIVSITHAAITHGKISHIRSHVWVGEHKIKSIVPRAAMLDADWKAIRDEAVEIFNNPQSWGSKLKRSPALWTGSSDIEAFANEVEHEKKWFTAWSKDGKWKNFGLMLNDRRLTDKCPRTIETLRKLGGVQIAGFSLLEPDAVIEPHVDSTGLKNGSIAYHLGLVTPPDCTLSIIPDEQNREVIHITQREGQAFCFDSNIKHSAMNRSDRPRIILYADLKL